MDIEDAFTEEAINKYDTNVTGETEAEVHDIIERIYRSNEIEATDDHAKVAILAFVAGRTYQADLAEEPIITVEMNGQLVSDFLRFLAREGRDD